MKNIIILAMSCRDSFFESQIEDIKNTYASKLQSNIKFMYYDGCWKNTKIVDDHLMIHSDDDLQHTFMKTYCALNYLYNNDKTWDYIFRTNTSTYVNTSLLNMFVQEYAEADIVYGSDLYSLSEAECPFPLHLYARGNGILLSRKNVEIILKEGIPFIYTKIVDDVAIGNILNSYHIKRNENYLDYIKGIPHAWYKSTNTIQSNGHKLSRYGESNINYEECITVQVKSYIDRSVESEHYRQLHDKIINKTCKFDETYMNNPSVFVGSSIGYIDYNIWISLDKQKLYQFEITHKGQDDPESKRVYNTRWDPN